MAIRPCPESFRRDLGRKERIAMDLFQGEKVYLRALEPEDLSFLYTLENDTDIWEISGTLSPYSRKILRDYLATAHRDIFEVKQVRMAICLKNEACIGLVDLYDFDPRHRRAGVGIVIAGDAHRHKGYGKEALQILCEYGFGILDLHQLYAAVGANNTASIKLFEKLGFVATGRKKDWNRMGSGFQDELFFQKFR